MKTLAVLIALVAAAAANPAKGQFVLTKDYSTEDGIEYAIKYVQPYTPGQRMPLFDPYRDSSEEVRRYLASQQAGGLGSWADRVARLRKVLTTGLDVSDELYRRTYSTGVTLPANRPYFVDSSGEIYYDPGQQAKLKFGAGVQIVKK